MCAVAEGVLFQAAIQAGRAPTPTDVFEDPARWGQLAITSFKVTRLCVDLDATMRRCVGAFCAGGVQPGTELHVE